MNNSLKALSGIALSVLFATGCATTSAAGTAAAGAASSAATAAAPSAISTLASSLGINEGLVQTALTAAQGMFGSSQKTADDKTAAAQAGVNAAAAKATENGGTALTDVQKSGLLDGIKGML